MTHCYKFNELNFKYGIYDNSIDVTYILTLKKSPKIKNIQKQLTHTKPSKKIFIVVNEGFKKCPKKLLIQNTTYDIMHSYIEIFKHAQKKNYQNILILEDDFIFDKEIHFLKNTTKINDFCNKHKKKNFILSLGSLPFIIFPYNDFFYKSIISTGTQSMIYSRQFIDKTLMNIQKVKKIHDWDYYTNTTFNRYLFHIPLITQIFNETENQKNWDSLFGLKYIFLYFIKKNKLNIKSQPGFDNFYFYSKIISISLVLLCIFIIYLLFHLGRNIVS